MYASVTGSVLSPSPHNEKIGFDIPDAVYNAWRNNPTALSNKIALAWWIWTNELGYPSRTLAVNNNYTAVFADGHSMTFAYNVNPGIIQELAVNAIT